MLILPSLAQHMLVSYKLYVIKDLALTMNLKVKIKYCHPPPHPACPPQCLEDWRRTVHSADSADGSEGCVAIIILTPTMLFFVSQLSGCYSIIQWYSVTLLQCYAPLRVNFSYLSCEQILHMR